MDANLDREGMSDVVADICAAHKRDSGFVVSNFHLTTVAEFRDIKQRLIGMRHILRPFAQEPSTSLYYPTQDWTPYVPDPLNDSGPGLKSKVRHLIPAKDQYRLMERCRVG